MDMSSDMLVTGTSSPSSLTQNVLPRQWVLGFFDDDEQPHALDPVFNRDRAEAVDVAIPSAPGDKELIGVGVEHEQQEQKGAEIPQGQVVIAPERGDHIMVTGVEIFQDTRLATLREACSFYNLSTSGSCERCFCFKRLFEHQKELELQVVS